MAMYIRIISLDDFCCLHICIPAYRFNENGVIVRIFASFLCTIPAGRFATTRRLTSCILLRISLFVANVVPSSFS